MVAITGVPISTAVVAGAREDIVILEAQSIIGAQWLTAFHHHIIEKIDLDFVISKIPDTNMLHSL